MNLIDVGGTFMKKIIFGIVLAFFTLGTLFLFQNAYINIDNFNDGKLLSIKVTRNFCDTSVCSDSDQIIVIADHESMKSIESIFFGKISNNLLGYTKEKGNYDFEFHYEKATLNFNVGIDQEFSSGKIKYTAKHRDYPLSTKDVEIIMNILENQVEDN